MDSSIDNQQNPDKQNPLVSIILPVYNGEALIARALDSVARQSFDRYELIVINDGSTDGTAGMVKIAAARDSRIIYKNNEKNLGIQASLNRGLEIARGKYIARIDCDDQWVGNDKLARQVRLLEDKKDYVLVGTGAVVINEKDEELFRFLEPTKDKVIRRMLLGKNCFLHSSVLMRKDSVMDVGGYDAGPEVEHVEDYDLWLKLGKVGKLANLSIYGLKYTISSTQISSQNLITQLKRNIYLMHRYGNYYPCKTTAWIRNYVRLIVYGYLRWSVLRKASSMIYMKKYSE